MKSLGGKSSFFLSYCRILNMDGTHPYEAVILVPSFWRKKAKNEAETCTHAQAYELGDSYIATRFVQQQFHDHAKRVVVFIITFTLNIIRIGDCQLYKPISWVHFLWFRIMLFTFVSHSNLINSSKFRNPLNRNKIEIVVVSCGSIDFNIAWASPMMSNANIYWYYHQSSHSDRNVQIGEMSGAQPWQGKQ